MSTAGGRGNRRDEERAIAHAPDVMSGRSGTFPEVRLPPPPRDRLPAPPEMLAPTPERVDTADVPPEGRAPDPGASPPKALRSSDEPDPRGPSNREFLRRALSTPGAARQAFLLREVLGPPVSFRANSDERPS